MMRVRAESADGTRQRILDAAVEELWERPLSEVRLEDVATRADVTVQTVLRVFGSKSDLLERRWTRYETASLSQRETAEPGDVDGTISAL